MSPRNELGFLLKLSRFRFWIYTGGTYVVGFALGASSLSGFFGLGYYVYLLYFFVLANIFIYGVNDFWDQDTDRINPKKDQKEYRISGGDRKRIALTLAAVAVISLALMFTQDNDQRLVFGSFLFLSYFYSARPLRFKSLPFVDFASNILYVMPGIFGYYLASGSYPPLVLVVAGFAHVSAMHIFSAIPDIEFDSKTGIRTTAVFLREKPSMALVLFFWSVLAVLTVILAGFHPLSFLVFIYPAIPLALLVNERLKVEKVYWYLPYVNTSLGGLLFSALVINIAMA